MSQRSYVICEAGMSVYDARSGSAGLLIACEHVVDEKMKRRRCVARHVNVTYSR